MDTPFIVTRIVNEEEEPIPGPLFRSGWLIVAVVEIEEVMDHLVGQSNGRSWLAHPGVWGGLFLTSKQRNWFVGPRKST